MSDQLTLSEEKIMRETFRATMLRAADIIDKITQDDVTEYQAALLASGCALAQVARIDRAMVAAEHLRACVEAAAAKKRGRL